jgi:hypothetical protein
MSLNWQGEISVAKLRMIGVGRGDNILIPLRTLETNIHAIDDVLTRLSVDR